MNPTGLKRVWAILPRDQVWGLNLFPSFQMRDSREKALPAFSSFAVDITSI
jgi:hypothetical protein